METTTRHEPTDDQETFAGAVVGNPVVQTLFAMAAVSLVTWTWISAGNIEPFALQAPDHEPWWQLIVSVYAHLSPSHLLANSMLIIVAGGLVALTTTRLRFHLFFIVTGALAGVAHVWATDLLGTPVGVLGASGAAFALGGYVLTANPASSAVLGRIPVRAVLVLVAVLALVMTIFLSGDGSAYIAHFTGAVLGLLAGQIQLLRA